MENTGDEKKLTLESTKTNVIIIEDKDLVSTFKGFLEDYEISWKTRNGRMEDIVLRLKFNNLGVYTNKSWLIPRLSSKLLNEVRAWYSDITSAIVIRYSNLSNILGRKFGLTRGFDQPIPNTNYTPDLYWEEDLGAFALDFKSQMSPEMDILKMNSIIREAEDKYSSHVKRLYIIAILLNHNWGLKYMDEKFNTFHNTFMQFMASAFKLGYNLDESKEKFRKDYEAYNIIDHLLKGEPISAASMEQTKYRDFKSKMWDKEVWREALSHVWKNCSKQYLNQSEAFDKCKIHLDGREGNIGISHLYDRDKNREEFKSLHGHRADYLLYFPLLKNLIQISPANTNEELRALNTELINSIINKKGLNSLPVSDDVINLLVRSMEGKSIGVDDMPEEASKIEAILLSISAGWMENNAKLVQKLSKYKAFLKTEVEYKETFDPEHDLVAKINEYMGEFGEHPEIMEILQHPEILQGTNPIGTSIKTINGIIKQVLDCSNKPGDIVTMTKRGNYNYKSFSKFKHDMGIERGFNVSTKDKIDHIPIFNKKGELISEEVYDLEGKVLKHLINTGFKCHVGRDAFIGSPDLNDYINGELENNQLLINRIIDESNIPHYLYWRVKIAKGLQMAFPGYSKRTAQMHDFNLVTIPGIAMWMLYSKPPNENTSGSVTTISYHTSNNFPESLLPGDVFEVRKGLYCRISHPFRLNGKMELKWEAALTGYLSTSLLSLHYGSEIHKSEFYNSLFLEYHRQVNLLVCMIYLLYKNAVNEGSMGGIEYQTAFSELVCRDPRVHYALVKLKKEYPAFSKDFADYMDNKKEYCKEIFSGNVKSLQSVMIIMYMKNIFPKDDGYPNDTLTVKFLQKEALYQDQWKNSKFNSTDTMGESQLFGLSIADFAKKIFVDEEQEIIAYHPAFIYWGLREMCEKMMDRGAMCFNGLNMANENPMDFVKNKKCLILDIYKDISDFRSRIDKTGIFKTLEEYYKCRGKYKELEVELNIGRTKELMEMVYFIIRIDASGLKGGIDWGPETNIVEFVRAYSNVLSRTNIDEDLFSRDYELSKLYDLDKSIDVLQMFLNSLDLVFENIDILFKSPNLGYKKSHKYTTDLRNMLFIFRNARTIQNFERLMEHWMDVGSTRFMKEESDSSIEQNKEYIDFLAQANPKSLDFFEVDREKSAKQNLKNAKTFFSTDNGNTAPGNLEETRTFLLYNINNPTQKKLRLNSEHRFMYDRKYNSHYSLNLSEAEFLETMKFKDFAEYTSFPSSSGANEPVRMLDLFAMGLVVYPRQLYLGTQIKDQADYDKRMFFVQQIQDRNAHRLIDTTYFNFLKNTEFDILHRPGQHKLRYIEELAERLHIKKNCGLYLVIDESKFGDRYPEPAFNWMNLALYHCNYLTRVQYKICNSGFTELQDRVMLAPDKWRTYINQELGYMTKRQAKKHMEALYHLNVNDNDFNKNLFKDAKIERDKFVFSTVSSPISVNNSNILGESVAEVTNVIGIKKDVGFVLGVYNAAGSVLSALSAYIQCQVVEMFMPGILISEVTHSDDKLGMVKVAIRPGEKINRTSVEQFFIDVMTHDLKWNGMLGEGTILRAGGKEYQFESHKILAFLLSVTILVSRIVGTKSSFKKLAVGKIGEVLQVLIHKGHAESPLMRYTAAMGAKLPGKSPANDLYASTGNVLQVTEHGGCISLTIGLQVIVNEMIKQKYGIEERPGFNCLLELGGESLSFLNFYHQIGAVGNDARLLLNSRVPGMNYIRRQMVLTSDNSAIYKQKSIMANMSSDIQSDSTVEMRNMSENMGSLMNRYDSIITDKRNIRTLKQFVNIVKGVPRALLAIMEEIDMSSIKNEYKLEASRLYKSGKPNQFIRYTFNLLMPEILTRTGGLGSYTVSHMIKYLKRNYQESAYRIDPAVHVTQELGYWNRVYQNPFSEDFIRKFLPRYPILSRERITVKEYWDLIRDLASSNLTLDFPETGLQFSEQVYENLVKYLSNLRMVYRGSKPSSTLVDGQWMDWIKIVPPLKYNWPATKILSTIMQANLMGVNPLDTPLAKIYINSVGGAFFQGALDSVMNVFGNSMNLQNLYNNLHGYIKIFETLEPLTISRLAHRSFDISTNIIYNTHYLTEEFWEVKDDKDTLGIYSEKQVSMDKIVRILTLCLGLDYSKRSPGLEIENFRRYHISELVVQMQQKLKMVYVERENSRSSAILILIYMYKQGWLSAYNKTHSYSTIWHMDVFALRPRFPEFLISGGLSVNKDFIALTVEKKEIKSIRGRKIEKNIKYEYTLWTNITEPSNMYLLIAGADFLNRVFLAKSERYTNFENAFINSGVHKFDYSMNSALSIDHNPGLGNLRIKYVISERDIISWQVVKSIYRDDLGVYFEHNFPLTHDFVTTAQKNLLDDNPRLYGKYEYQIPIWDIPRFTTGFKIYNQEEILIHDIYREDLAVTFPNKVIVERPEKNVAAVYLRSDSLIAARVNHLNIIEDARKNLSKLDTTNLMDPEFTIFRVFLNKMQQLLRSIPFGPHFDRLTWEVCLELNAINDFMRVKKSRDLYKSISRVLINISILLRNSRDHVLDLDYNSYSDTGTSTEVDLGSFLQDFIPDTNILPDNLTGMSDEEIMGLIKKEEERKGFLGGADLNSIMTGYIAEKELAISIYLQSSAVMLEDLKRSYIELAVEMLFNVIGVNTQRETLSSIFLRFLLHMPTFVVNRDPSIMQPLVMQKLIESSLKSFSESGNRMVPRQALYSPGFYRFRKDVWKEVLKYVKSLVDLNPIFCNYQPIFIKALNEFSTTRSVVLTASLNFSDPNYAFVF